MSNKNRFIDMLSITGIAIGMAMGILLNGSAEMKKERAIQPMHRMGLLRKVESVENGPDGRTTVIFFRAPSFYFVSKDRAGSQKMILLLREAARTHQEVLVVFHPSTLEILDVQFPAMRNSHDR